MFRNLINCYKISKERKKNQLYEFSKMHANAKSLYYDIVIRLTLRATGRPSIIEFSYHVGNLQKVNGNNLWILQKEMFFSCYQLTKLGFRETIYQSYKNIGMKWQILAIKDRVNGDYIVQGCSSTLCRYGR